MNIEFLKETAFLWGEPVPFEDFVLSPVKLKDYIEFMYAVDVLQIIKEDFAATQDVMYNVRVVQMSNLEFLCSQMQERDERGRYTQNASMRADQLRVVFKLSLGLDVREIRYMFDANKKQFIVLDGKHMIDHLQFDELRRLICYQNLPDYDDAYVSKHLRDEMKRVNALRSKVGSFPTFEERVTAFCSHLGVNRSAIAELTVREFIMHESMYQDIEQYRMLKQAELGGMVEFKKSIEHYLFKPKRSKTDGYLVDYDGFTDNMKKTGAMSVK